MKRNRYRAILSWLDAHFEETLLVIFLAAIAAIQLLQVIIRKLPFIPALTWAEEFCRFMWIWSVFISLPYTIRKGTALRVTAFKSLFGERGKRALDILADAATLLAMLFCACFSVPVVTNVFKSGESSPAMLWRMWPVFSFMTLGFALAAFRALQCMIRHIRKGGDE